MRTAAIVIGHSHLSSLISALVERAGESYDKNVGVEYFIFNTMKHGATFNFSIDSGGGHFVLNPEIKRVVDATVPTDYARLYISMFGGNAHNALTLLEHPSPFDLVLPAEEARPRVEGARLLPYTFVEKFIKGLAEPYLLNMACLRNAVPDDVVHIESPPPIGDSQFILRNLEQYFKDQSVDPKVAPRELRYKLWRVHSTIVSSAAAAHGIDFLPAPQGGLNPDGFLTESDYGADSTHAGKNYGLRVLKQIEERVGEPYGGWGWL